MSFVKYFPLIFIACFISRESIAGDGVNFTLGDDGGGLVIGIESESIYNSSVDLPIVLSPAGGRGVSLVFVGADGREHALCAHVDPSGVPKKSILYFRHKVSIYERYENIKRIYCIEPGRYTVYGSYRGVYFNDHFGAIRSNEINVVVR